MSLLVPNSNQSADINLVFWVRAKKPNPVADEISNSVGYGVKLCVTVEFYFARREYSFSPDVAHMRIKQKISEENLLRECKFTV